MKFSIRILTSVLLLAFTSLNATDIAYGAYTGDGAATKTISGLPFNPEAVMVKAVTAHAAWIATNDMPSGEAKNLATSAALEADLISSFGTNAFTVGTSDAANASGVLYHYVAFDQTTDVAIGSYTGTGGVVTNNGINTGGSEIVWIFPDAAEPSSFHVSQRGNISGSWITGSNDGQTYFWAASASGFTCGTGASTSSVEYYYIAIDVNDSDVQDFAYEGNETDGKALTSFGFEPQLAMTFTYGGEGPVAFKTKTMTGDNAFRITATTAETDLIKSFDVDGVTLGSDPVANPIAGGSWNSIVALQGLTSLPVELTSFKATKKSDFVELYWETAGEINSSHYIIEKSIDSENWEELIYVEGAGTTTEFTNYSVFDKEPNEGSNYYRLKQVDYDGKSEYFRTLQLYFSDKAETIKTFPNPADDNLNVVVHSFGKDDANLNVHDELGKLVLTKTVELKDGNNSINLELIDLPTGNYFLQISGKRNHSSVFSVR